AWSYGCALARSTPRLATGVIAFNPCRMGELSESNVNDAARIAAGDDGTRYDGVAITLHWLTALLVVTNFALAQIWDWFPDETKGWMEDAHMSFGVLLAVVVVARLVWRLLPGHQVSSLAAGWMRLASKATHYLLYTP